MKHLLGTVKVKSHSVMSKSLRPHELYSPWDSPGRNTGVGSLSLLQGIFPTQRWNLDLPHCRQIPYRLSHQGEPMRRHTHTAAGKLRNECGATGNQLRPGQTVNWAADRGLDGWAG